MIVYIYTFPNGKKYVGQTIQTLEQRAHGGSNYKGCSAVYAAIQKYGWDNIQKETIECHSEAELDELEIALIEKYQTMNPEFGYNLNSGGHKNRHLSDQTKQKLSELNSGENHPNYGKHLSEETKKKISEAQKGEKSFWYGKHPTEETRKKLSESHKGKLPSNAWPVICLETGKIYESSGIAAREMGLKSCNSISYACKGIKKSAAGYHWKYLKDFEEEKGENE